MEKPFFFFTKETIEDKAWELEKFFEIELYEPQPPEYSLDDRNCSGTFGKSVVL